MPSAAGAMFELFRNMLHLHLCGRLRRPYETI
jgi:hypothetical protein